MTVDVNVALHRWPFRRLPGDEPAELVARLRARQVTQAWAGSFDALLHRDLAAVNRRLAEDCRAHGAGLLVPFGTVHPLLPDAEEELRRCAEEHRMPGLRLFPNYHGYRLDDPPAVALFRAAAARGLLVQIVVKMEDERTQHPLVRVPSVDLTPLPKLLAEVKGLRLVLLNGPGALNPDQLRAVVSAGPVSLDLAMVEGAGGVGKLLQVVPIERALFGSHFPFFYHESATLKLRESALSPEQEKAIRTENARRLLVERSRP